MGNPASIRYNNCMTVSDELKQTIGRALGRVPSGIFVLTAVTGGKPAAMLVSWVQQAGFQPPAISVAIAKERGLIGALTAGARFALSIIPDGGTKLMKKYARGVPEGADPFEDVATKPSPSGVPYLAEALAYLDCRVMMTCDPGGDHVLVVAEITAGELLHDGHAFTHTRGNGFHY